MDEPTTTTLSPDALLHQADEYTRREPRTALASAFGVGLLLNLLPIRSVVGLVASIAIPLLRPALLVLGLVKAYELLRSQEPTSVSYE